MDYRKLTRLALFAGLLLAAPAYAQDSGALLNLLVKKGIVSDQEAEDLRVELTKEFVNNTAAGKLDLTGTNSRFRLNGDMRMRYEFNSQVPELATGAATVANETSRQRFRMRLNADFWMTKGWNTGIALESTQSGDSGNQTFVSYHDDYGVFMTRAFVGWQPSLNWNFVLGKQRQPMYIPSDLRWDGDYNPQALSETYTHFIGIKDTFQIRAMQGILDDRAEATAGPGGRDAWSFDQQAIYTHWFQPDNLSSFTFALGFTSYNQSTITTSPLGSSAFVGSLRGQNYVSASGELALANFGGRTGSTFRVYWDSSKNLLSQTRVYQVYGLNPAVFSDDPTAWLAGIGYAYGAGTVQGDYGIRVDYRDVGIGSLDPNTNDSDWGFSKLNQKGWKVALTYGLTNFANFNVTYFDTKIKQPNMTFSLGNLDRSQEVLVDLIVRY